MNFHERANAFKALCLGLDLPVPALVEIKVTPATPCDFTSAAVVGLNLEAAGDMPAKEHAAHVFGHYLGDLHSPDGESVYGRGIYDRVAAAVQQLLVLGQEVSDGPV